MTELTLTSLIFAIALGTFVPCVGVILILMERLELVSDHKVFAWIGAIAMVVAFISLGVMVGDLGFLVIRALSR